MGGVTVHDVAEVDGEVKCRCAIGGVVGECVEVACGAVERVLICGADVGVGEGGEAEAIGLVCGSGLG